MSRQYQFTVEGTAAQGQTWTATGTVATEHSGDFPVALDEAMRQTFQQITNGKAVYGKPGLGCRGPYTIMRFELKQVLQ